MKILIVSGMFPPIRTGTAFYTQNLAQSLKAYGHDVQIISLGKHGKEVIQNIVVHRIPAINFPLAGFFKHFRLCAWNILNWWRINSILRKSNSEVIILVNHYLDIAFPVIFASYINKIPLVCSVGTQLQSLNPIRNKILNLLDKVICGLIIFPCCKRIIAWDSQIKQYLQDVHGDNILNKISIVNYGVNGNAKELLSYNHNYEIDNIIIGVGAVSEQRSFVPLVKAFSSLIKKFPRLRLRIVGHVYYDEACKLAKSLGIEDKIDFTGEKPHEEVVKLMCSSTLFYSSLTGQYVGLGTATIEAMLLGLPTVVNTPLNLLGNVDLIDNFHLIQCTSTDSNHISSAIESLLSNPSLRSTVGIGGREFVEKNLNWEVVAKNMSEVLQKVVEIG